MDFAWKDALHPAPNPSSMLSVRSEPSSLFFFCVQKDSRITWRTLITNSADSSTFSIQFQLFHQVDIDLLDNHWTSLESNRA